MSVFLWTVFPLSHVVSDFITVYHSACLRRVSSCTPVSMPLFAYGLRFGSCVCYSFISLSAPPCTVTRSPFLLIVLPLCQARESGAGGACRKSSSLVAPRGKANSETRKHRKCCFPHAGSSLGIRHSENGNLSAVSNHTCLCEPFGLLHVGWLTCTLRCQRTQQLHLHA